MNAFRNHLSKFKSRYQKITFFILMFSPMLVFFGAKNENSLWIIIGMILIACANLLAIINK